MGKPPKLKRPSSVPPRDELPSQPPLGGGVSGSGSPTNAVDGEADEHAGSNWASPHDELFKTTFESIEAATSLLRSALPASIARRLDWSTLELQPTEQVDRHLDKRYGDLVFRVQLADNPRQVFIDVVLEHQSTPERTMPLRMLGFIVRRTEALWRASKQSTIPIVLPVVLYQGRSGRPTPWRHPTRFSELLDADEETLAAFRPYIPDFEFVLDDLPAQSDEELFKRQLTEAALVVLWLLRNVGLDDARLIQIMQQDQSIFGSLRRLAEQSSEGHGSLVAIYTYLYRTIDVSDETIHHLAQALGNAAEEAEMTAAQRLIEQGIAKGIAKGMAKGMAEGRAQGAAAVLERQIARRFGSIDEVTRARLAQASSEQLEVWSDRILFASGLEELFSE